MLDKKAKTLNPTQAELGGEASPPSAASASAADLARTAAKRCKTAENGGTRLKNVAKIHPETSLKNRLKQNAEKFPIIATHDPKSWRPEAPEATFELHRGT